MKSFDVVVIGGGPGGYIAAIRAAQLGLAAPPASTSGSGADGKPALGGTCTNVGCIPSKALLQSSENFEQAGHHFAEHGIKVKGLELDLAQMLKRKDKVVKPNNDGIVYLFKKNKIDVLPRPRQLRQGAPIEVVVGRRRRCTAKHVIIATGSNPRAAAGRGVRREADPRQRRRARASPEVPKRLGVIGAGVIGLEMGSVWRRLGSRGDDPGGAAGVPRRGRRGGREGGGEDLRQAGPEDRARREDRQGRQEENRYGSIYCIR